LDTNGFPCHEWVDRYKGREVNTWTDGRMVVQLLFVNPSNQLTEKLFSVIEEAGDNYLVQQLGFQHGTSLGYSVCAAFIKNTFKETQKAQKTIN
jgi:hypothetical protein